MEFLNPAALYGLLALPLLLIPYLIRRKPQRVIFSSLLLFTEPVNACRWPAVGKTAFTAYFLSPALVADPIDSCLGEPVFSLRASNIAIVLDNSASMQTLENQQTRFALAQEKARAARRPQRHRQVDLYLTAPRLEKVRGTTFEPSEAAGVLTALTPYDLADTPIDYQRA